ncbi:hypothetical protein ORV05_05015 [Amycolatopsis cynarae]|uniref:Uncharacterized protein n=1 Tax=Amycolatopsis cynarae TaxID=2995223 RepID=A0ABY7B7I8_9PSEU|nr:hypothetical protein [Amycolatopsis sp. HUAS 11-8]WAL67153.1 hypothetical protein ORV05_05015 [Amycolatopsis sp. HUAS 11-8]
MELTDTLRLRGRLRLLVLDEDNRVVDEREGDNVICTTGYTALAAALVWSGVQDQATNLGVTNPTYLAPLYGAVGSGAGTPAKADTALFSELGRQVVGAGAASPATASIAAQATWLFYFPSPTTTWTVTEAGLFAGATATAGSGSMIDHWAFTPSVTISTTNALILQVSLLLGP